MTKKAQVKKSTGRRSIKRSKRQVKQRRSTRRSTPRAKPRSRTSHYRNVRGGGKGLATLGVSTVGTGMGGSAAYLYLRNQRKEQIKDAIKKFKETYPNREAYDTIKQILEDGYGFDEKKILDYKNDIESFLNLEYNDINNISIVSNLLRVNFKFDDVENLVNQTKDTKDIGTMLIALFIKDCGFATALYILGQQYLEYGEAEFLRQNLNIVALYVRDTNATEEGNPRKQKFITKYTGLYKTPQFTPYYNLQESLDKESFVRTDGDYLFDRIHGIPEIQNLQCIITPGAYDSFLVGKDTVYNTIDQYRRDTSGSGGPVLLSSI